MATSRSGLIDPAWMWPDVSNPFDSRLGNFAPGRPRSVGRAFDEVAEALPTELPFAGSRAWQRIAKRGCIGGTSDRGEFTCEYDWGCRECPVNMAAVSKKNAKPAVFSLRKYRTFHVTPK